MGMEGVVTLAEAIGRIESGSTVGIGGSITTRKPVALVQQLARSGTTDLHLVSFTGSIAIDLLIGAGVVSSVASGYMGLGHFGRAPNFVKAVESGTIEDREYSEWLLLQRIRAGAMGLPFLPTRAAAGSQITKLHSFASIPDPYSGDTVIALPPLELDVALVHAWRGSPEGYVQLAEPPDHLWDIDVMMARASKFVIVSVDEIVDLETVSGAPHLTQLFPVDVDVLVHAPRGAWPTASRPTYDADGEALARYAAEGVLPS
jgi:glutaconate CoA-transferase subunit A